MAILLECDVPHQITQRHCFDTDIGYVVLKIQIECVIALYGGWVAHLYLY